MSIITEYNNAKGSTDEPEAIEQASMLTWEMVNDHLGQHITDKSRYVYTNLTQVARRQPFVFKDKDTLFAPLTVRTTPDSSSDGWEALTPHTQLELTNPRGGEMTMRLLPPIVQSGPHAGCVKREPIDDLIHSEAGIKELTACLPDLPPSVFDAKVMRGFRPAYVRVSYNDMMATPIACSGKPVATINKWLKRYDLPPIDTERSNRWLADISTALAAREFTVEWIPEGVKISEVYSEWEGEDADNAPELGSCMSGNNSDYFELYDDLQGAGKLTMMLIKDRGRHCGRALVWRDCNQLYLDRVYCIRINSAFPQKAVEAVHRFIGDEGIEKCVYSTDKFSMHLTSCFLSVRLPYGSENYECVPYVDSMRFWYDDGYLSSSSQRSSRLRAELNRTDGELDYQDDEFDEPSQVEDIHGDWVDENDAIYLTRYEGYVRTEHTTRTYWSGLIDDDDVVYLSDTFYGAGERTAHADDTIMTANDERIAGSHACLVGDRWYHQSQVILNPTTGSWELLGEANTDTEA